MFKRTGSNHRSNYGVSLELSQLSAFCFVVQPPLKAAQQPVGKKWKTPSDALDNRNLATS